MGSAPWESELGPEQMQAVVDRAVDRVAEGFPRMFRGRDGSTVQSRLEADGARLTFDGANGHRTTRYRFEGDTLQVDVSVESERLPEPMTWPFRYTRVQP